MKQIFLVGLKVDISYDLVEKKLFSSNDKDFELPF